jgi:zinc/manganese transport system substrate-binding protein
MHSRFTKLLLALAPLLVAATAARGELKVVATTPNFADIARSIGGEHVSIETIMKPRENVHNVSPKPSHMMRLKRADLFLYAGLDGEPWVPNLIKGARESKFLPGGNGLVDLSRGVTLKEVPQRNELSRALGDIHAFGNTHYAMDPLNGVIIARTIADAFALKDPTHAGDYEANYEAFASAMQELTDRLLAESEPIRGAPVVVYHRSWPYFLDRFGLVKVGEIEPKPGIAPGPQHMAATIETMEANHVRAVIVEPYNHSKTADRIAERAGAEVVELCNEVGAVPGVDSYAELFVYNVGALVRTAVAPPPDDAP